MFIIIVIIIQIFFFIIFPLIASGKVEAGKLFKWLLYIITLVTLGIMIFPIISQSTDFETSDDSIADGFVKLDVDKKQKVAVEEDITINWEESGHHGIYKFTPEWLKYTSKEGKTIRRKSTITNLRAEVPERRSNNTMSTTDSNQEGNYGYRHWYEQYNYESTYKYSVDEVNKKKRIKIGSPDVTLWTGEKDYIIKYDYDMGSDPYEGYDEFIFHAYGDFWGTDINNPTIEITMPKSIENNNIHFFMDKKRKYDVTDSVDYTVSGNKLIAKFNIEKYIKNKKENNPYYALETALTVDIELPDNYFDNGSFNYGYRSLSCIIICLIIMLISFLLWFFFGKDYEKKAKVVSYMPPRELSAAEIGYIDANGYSKKLVISLVVELAAKKMINIRENKSGDILIKGFKPNKEDKDYEKKLKAYEKKIDKLNSYEKKVLNELVKDDTATLVIPEKKTTNKIWN